MLRRVFAAAVTAACLIGTIATPVSASVAPDDQTAVRAITFPVDGGERRYSDTFGACRSGCSRSHEGTDIMAPKLTKLLAARDATVTWSKNTATADGSQGNYLMLTDDDGWEYWYIHINNDSPGTDDGANPTEWIFAPRIDRGSKVVAGQHIAYVGDSGNAEQSGSQLHFEIRKPDGSVINPYESLQAAGGAEPMPADAGSSESDRLFVRALAADFLDRASTDAEETRDVDRIAEGTPRASIVEGYAQSPEWVSALITEFYDSTLGRTPDAGGLQYWIDQIDGGMTPAAVASRFYASPEYFNRSGGTNRAWVTDLYQEILHRDPDPGGLRHWVDNADAGVSPTVIAADFYGSLESRRTRVAGLYASLLDRAPDPSGLTHWSERLSHGRDLDLAVMLASSQEYFQRAATRTDLG